MVVDHFLGDNLGLGDGGVGAVLVADVPGEDVVVMLARTMRARGLPGKVFAQHRRIGQHRLERVGDDRQFLVFHLDQFHRVGGDVAVFGHDEGDLLALEQHLAVGQHHLLVARQRRHPVQAQRAQVIGGQHGDDAGQRLRGIGVDRLHAGVGIGRAHEIAKQHPRHLDVVDVVALALGEAHVLDPLARGAHAFEFLDPLVAGWCLVVHSAASLAAFISAAAARMDLTMFW